MRHRNIVASNLIALPVTLALAVLPACGQAPDGAAPAGGAVETINTHPANFEEARAAIDQIAGLQRANPQDPRALEALSAIQPSLDSLNHLVARLEPQPGHVVRFYESAPGVIGVSEAAPIGEKGLLGNIEEDSVLGVYRKLAGGADPPAAMLEALQRSVPATSAVSQHVPGFVAASPSDRPTPATGAPALGASLRSPSTELNASQAQWYAANGCFEGGDSHACLPNWWNGGYAEYWAKTSFFQVAPFSGTVYVQGKYQGTVVNLDPVFAGQWLFWWRASTTQCVGYQPPGYGPYESCWFTDYTIADQRWDILDAEGQEFDWSYEGRWNCNLQTYQSQVTGLPLCNNP